MKKHAPVAFALLVAVAAAVTGCATTGDASKPAPIETAKPTSPAPVQPASQPEPAPPPPGPVAIPAPPSPPPTPPVVEKPEPPKPRPVARLEAGTHNATIAVGNLKRTYVVRVPKGLDTAKPAPLVVVLHARGSSAKGATVYGFDHKAEREGFVVAYPEAIGQPHVWNAIHDRGTSSADDVAFVIAMLDEISGGLNVDRRRVYLVGSSSGGMMAYRLAAEHPERFAAAAVFAGSVGTLSARGVMSQIPKAAAPVSILHVHGKRDRTVPYDGGKSVTLNGTSYVGAVESARFWADVDGCERDPATATVGPLTRDVWSRCRGGARVELVSIDAISHSWPTSVKPDARRPAQSMADMIWDFFKGRARPQAAAGA